MSPLGEEHTVQCRGMTAAVMLEKPDGLALKYGKSLSITIHYNKYCTTY